VSVPGAPEHRFAGAEKSTQRRTNLALVEVSGLAATLLVRGYSPTGQLLASRSYPLAAGQYQSNTDIFGPDGLALGDGPFQNYELSAQVTSAQGRVLSHASVIDNVSRNPKIFILNDAGPPSDPYVGR
jgi:hypothetical protein